MRALRQLLAKIIKDENVILGALVLTHYLLCARNSPCIKFNTHKTCLREGITDPILEIEKKKVYKENTQREQGNRYKW